MDINAIINERHSRFIFHQNKGRLTTAYKLRFIPIIHRDFNKGFN